MLEGAAVANVAMVEVEENGNFHINYSRYIKKTYLQVKMSITGPYF